MFAEETCVLDGVPLNGRQRLGSVRHSRGIAEIDESLIRQMLVQSKVDGEPANAAVEDANGKMTIHERITEITHNNPTRKVARAQGGLNRRGTRILRMGSRARDARATLNIRAPPRTKGMRSCTQGIQLDCIDARKGTVLTNDCAFS